MNAKIITITNHKGGVGKTTTAISLAHVLTMLNRKVLLVDFDPQGQCATALGMDPEGGVFNLLLHRQDPHQWVRLTGRENLNLIPGDHSTATAQIVISAESRSIDAIAIQLHTFSKEYDYIFLDTAPSVGGIQERAIWASDFVIVPTATEFLSADGVRHVVELMQALARREWRGKLLGVLPTFYDETTRETKSTIESLSAAFGDRLCAPIHRATILRECAAEGVTIFEKDPTSRAAAEYRTLAEMILKF